MAMEIETPIEPSTTSLVGGILDDMQQLVKQQIQLTRKEVTQEAHKAAEAAVFFASGAAVLFLGAILVSFALAYWLHSLGSTGVPEPGMLPLWACFAIVGGPVMILGAGLTWLGRDRLASINPWRNPATEALKENVQWATNAKPPIG